MDVSAMTIANVEETLPRVQDDQHLDPQRLTEARIDVGMRLF